jgi:hypothetical protein
VNDFARRDFYASGLTEALRGEKKKKD